MNTLLLAAAALAFATSLGMFTGAMMVAIATRGRHPGWVAMLLVALLIEVSR